MATIANPMFTLAMMLVREITVREAIGDWIGQLAGGILGGALIFGINPSDLPTTPGAGQGQVQPGGQHPIEPSDHEGRDEEEHQRIEGGEAEADRTRPVRQRIGHSQSTLRRPRQRHPVAEVHAIAVAVDLAVAIAIAVAIAGSIWLECRRSRGKRDRRRPLGRRVGDATDQTRPGDVCALVSHRWGQCQPGDRDEVGSRRRSRSRWVHRHRRLG